MESSQTNTSFLQFSFWKHDNGHLRVINLTRPQSRSKNITSYPISDMIQILNTVRQQYGESILNIDHELSICINKKTYVSSLIEETLVDNDSLITLYPLTD